ncbi:hypothetical protein EON64_21185 [archaeon]|nr:MAG: hypothetical protein EON64_21185 [archaeon]
MDMLEGLAPEVARRVKKLRSMHDDFEALQSEYKAERIALERKFLARKQEQANQRKAIVTGEQDVEVTADGECGLIVYELVDIRVLSCRAVCVLTCPLHPLSHCLLSYAADSAVSAENVRGVPGFWMTALTGHPITASLITEEDIPLLEKLRDITADYSEGLDSFTLAFHFEANDFITNQVGALRCAY